MHFSYSAKDVTIVVITLLAASVIITRFRKGSEADWPVIFWAIVYGFNTTFDGPWPNHMLYVGIVISLIYRYEFMGQLVTSALKLLDVGVVSWLAYVGVVAAFNLQ